MTDEEIGTVVDALEASGHCIVPVKPTAEMLGAALTALGSPAETQDEVDMWLNKILDVWNAMLLAADLAEDENAKAT